MKTSYLSLFFGAMIPVVASAQLELRPWTLTNEPLETRVMSDFPSLAENTPFVHYDVPPMSDLKRLPDFYPTDGNPGKEVTIVAAGDEYEPGSFLIYPLRDLGKTQLTLTDFKTDDGKVFPKTDLDLKVIKVWYQNANGWYSYFGDNGQVLTPELLLNDEDLIKVDTEKKANYARLTDKGKISYQWLNPPKEMDRVFWDLWRAGDGFKPMKPNFKDAATLRPVDLKKGEMKNFFLTAHVRKGTPAGTYKGRVIVGTHGSIPIVIKVLDFTLPEPKCYFDDEMDFYVTSYVYNCLGMIMEENGGDFELAKKQFKATMENLVSHNQNISWIRTAFGAETKLLWEIMKEAGMRSDVTIGGVSVGKSKQTAKYNFEAAKKLFGHDNIYIGHGDEPSPKWVASQRDVFKANQEAGFKFIIAGGNQVFRKAGYIYDWHNIALDPENSQTTALWNQFATKPHIAWYARMHTGVENPAFNRRQNGMAPYLAGYSALCNYAHHFGPYNDNSSGYRPMVFAYGSHDGVIDTIQWEGFREGVDDIRYATCLVKLAREASKSDKTDIRYAGGKALQYLASFNKESDDLNACRAEMILHILKLKSLLGK